MKHLKIKSLLGKIIAIDLTSKNYELVSYGHRNPQGLYFHKEKNIIINTEHGPKGGDEINFNYLNLKEDKNFGGLEFLMETLIKGKIIFSKKILLKEVTKNLDLLNLINIMILLLE